MTQAQTQGIDIDSLMDTPVGDLTHTVGVEFNDDGDPISGFVIVGKDSDQYRNTAKIQRVTGIKRAAVKSKRIDTKTDDGAKTLDDLVSDGQTALAAAVVVSWFGFTRGGKPAPFSTEAVHKLFTVRQTLRDKVLGALEVEENFLPKSQPISSRSDALSLS